jgi:hypothetical protein
MVPKNGADNLDDAESAAQFSGCSREISARVVDNST